MISVGSADVTLIGSGDILFTATDTSGNASGAYVVITEMAPEDKDAPTITLNGGDTISVEDGQAVTIGGSFDEVVQSAEISIDGGEWQEATLENNGTSFSYSFVPTKATTNVEARATDLKGNQNDENNAEQTVEKKDAPNNAPEFPSAPSPDKNPTSSNIPVKITVPVLDVDGNDVTVSMSFEGDDLGCTFDEDSKVVVGGDGTVEFTMTPQILKSGNVTPVVTAKDGKGGENTFKMSVIGIQ